MPINERKSFHLRLQIGSLLWLLTFFNLYLVINEPELFQTL